MGMDSHDKVNWNFYPNIHIAHKGNETTPNVLQTLQTPLTNIFSEIYNSKRKDKILNQNNRLP